VAGGTGPGGKTIWEHTLEEVEEIFAVNVYGPFLTMKHFLPVMIEARRARWSTWAARSASRARPMSSAYGATKWALRGSPIPRRWRPGPTACGSTASIRAAWTGRACGGNWPRRRSGRARPGQKLYDDFAGRSALGKMSTDIDVANAVLFLLSDAAGNITGQDLLVDGGTVV
jgi:NAD(P)-dependent dehydrogenase (short-subunit alcohol dehydrogenase family)